MNVPVVGSVTGSKVKTWLKSFAGFLVMLVAGLFILTFFLPAIYRWATKGKTAAAGGATLTSATPEQQGWLGRFFDSMSA
jgi:hypothetical protein